MQDLHIATHEPLHRRDEQCLYYQLARLARTPQQIQECLRRSIDSR
jgi:hypothetical protein